MPIQTTFSRLPCWLRTCLLSLALATAGAGTAHGVPLTDLRAEDLLPMAGDLKQSLGLSPNQQTLWNKAEGASRTILRDRSRRRAALQEWTRTLLASPDADLRKLDAATDAESATANAEDRQLRAQWLDVNDGLDDHQRRQVASRLGEQLLRVVPDGSQRSGAPAGPRDEQNRRGGPGSGRSPGAGQGPGGPGGASLNFGG
ncbi:hypothetical protein IFT43_06810 [Oxalobacteraceae sp. CFBP 13708]|nr:hypothetical protein [Oxalobacteraceae sp. CFBP 13708]